MTTLIQRHYIKEFLKLFAVLALGLAVMFSAFELVQMIDRLMPYDPPMASLAKYVALKVPQYVLALMPVATLLCSLYTISHAVRQREIVAVMAAGGRVKQLLAPFIAMGLVLSVLAFALGEFVVPGAIRQAEDLKHRIRGEQAMPTLFKNGRLWLRANDGSMVKIEFFMPQDNTYRGISIFRITDSRLKEIILADKARHLPDKDTWRLSGVSIYNIATGEIDRPAEMMFKHLGPPDMLRETAKRANEMSIAELYRYAQRLKQAGFKNMRMTVDLHSKVSYPFINLIMILIGVSLPVRRNFSGFVATAIGLAITLMYWFGYTMMLTLGYAGIIPPFMAAWIMPLLVGGIGAWLYHKIPQ